MQLLNSILTIARRELDRILAKRSMYLLVVLLPIIVFTFFAYLYQSALVREIPIAIYDEDQTEVSRLISRYLDAASSMSIEKNVNSLDELKNEILSGKAYAGFYFPARMEEDIKSGKRSDVVILENAANIITGNTIMRDALTVTKTVSGGILLKKIRSGGWTSRQALDVINPVTLEIQSLFNSNYSYLNYIVPGFMIAILQMIILATSVLVINSEFTDKTFSDLVKLSVGKALPIMFGKSLPHIALHSMTILAIVGIIFPLFGIVINGSVLVTILFCIFFVVTVVALGIFLSTLFHDQIFASEVTLILGSPAFIFSGFTYPGWAMPLLHQAWAQLLPSTHFLLGLLKVYQMDAPFRFMLPEFFKLSVFLVLSIIFTWVVLKKKISNIDKTSTPSKDVA